MASSWVPGPELAWALHAGCPAPCVLFEAVRDGAGALLDFQWTSLNPAAEALVRELALERSLSRWSTALRGLPELPALGAVVGSGEPLAFEVHCTPGGTPCWYQARALPHGEGLVLWLFDTTGPRKEQHSLSEELERERAREEHLRLALETAGMVAWEWTEARSAVTWSPNAAAFFGLPPGGLGHTLDAFLERCVPPEERSRVSEAIEQGLRAQGPYTFQFRGRWPDGTLRLFEAVGQTFHEADTPSRMLGVVMDCTERERAQAAVREAEERYRLAAWATNDVLWDWHTLGGSIHWGEATLSVFGYRPEEMGDVDWWAEQVHPEDRALVLDGLRRVVEEGGESWSAEYRFRRKDGAYVHVLDRGVVARDARGRGVRMIGSMMDITERKRAVERMQEEAQFRERFIGILGHDLRSPLTAISLSVRSLRRRGPLTPAQLQLAQRIEASAGRMGTMISDILDLTRARLSGGIPLSLAPTRLPELCRQVVEELSVAYPGRHIVCEEHGEGEGVWDPERLAQVISNLVGNALVHGSPEGAVFVRCLGEGDTRVLEVSNPGAPIPRAQQATLFDPFRQGPSAKREKRSGLGLGLFIVREIVEAHGGQVSVRSSEEEGTTFSAVLPRDARRVARGLVAGEAHSA